MKLIHLCSSAATVRRSAALLVALVALVELNAFTNVDAVTYPPKIYLQPESNLLYKVDEFVTLPCKANGTAPITYTWQRQGKYFDPSNDENRYTQLPNTGTLIINSPQVDDEGTYQCFATNKYGTSVSSKVNLRRGDLQSFASASVVSRTQVVGSSLRLACYPPQSYPPATIYWAIRQMDGSLTPLVYNSRVTQDLDGNLYFVNLLASDANVGTSYVCVANNEYLRLLTHGPPTVLTVTGKQPQGSQPRLIYSSPYDMTGLVNTTVVFKCIFSGWPTPVISWIYQTESTPFPANTNLDSFGQTLIIQSAQSYHAGIYQCHGRNDQSQFYAPARFNLRIESAPYWIVQPSDITAGVGDTVAFRCLAGGTPAPTIYWFVNGIPISSVTAKPNRMLYDGTVYFTNVQLEDVTNLQCNATNKHGYVFADVFLNVRKNLELEERA